MKENRPLKVLIVEDRESDYVLLVRELRRSGYDLTTERVETAPAMRRALQATPYDLIISDYSLPQFSALQALTVTKELELDIPFIINSGTVGEETAVEAMRAGAHDFVVKGQYARLIPVIERELREAAFRAERRTMRQQLDLSERMASVGTLAAGVAHEINNPLAALVVNLEFALEGYNELVAAQNEAPAARPLQSAAQLTKLASDLRDAREAAERIRLIVRDLKVFSRGDDQSTGPVDVRQVLTSSLRMASNEIRHRARAITEFAEVSEVEANEARLGQVFLNLMINAAQAIPEGFADKNEIRIVARQLSPDQVVVEVRDTGGGIPPELLPRIFDPFFTTKPIGVGTGLGLSICHRIIVGLQGHMTVESEVGKGTVFRIALPVSKRPPSVVPAAPVATTTSRAGRILTIDDEPSLGLLLRRVLTPPHEVLCCTNGREALAMLASAGPFDVIFCDLMMPQMSGMDFYDELNRSDPKQAAKIVFMTGGAFTSGARDFLARVGNPRIEKPFQRAQLRDLVDSLLQ